MNKKFLSFGCSHTAGNGLDPGEIYVDVISKELNIANENLAVSGNNSNECLRQLVETLMIEKEYDFVIVQWPNIFRRTFYRGSKKFLENVNSASKIFFETLTSGKKNFVEPWIENILTANLLCNQVEIPLYNIYLDTLDPIIEHRLTSKGIDIHTDMKQPGKTWLFDNGAQDGMHHSPYCHREWASRLIGLINDYSPR